MRVPPHTGRLVGRLDAAYAASSFFLAISTIFGVSGIMFSTHVTEIPDNYASADLEPRVFDGLPAAADKPKLADSSPDNAPKSMAELYAFAETLPKETATRLRDEASKMFAALQPSEREATSVGALTLQLMLQEKRVHDVRNKMAAMSAAATTNRVIKPAGDSTVPDSQTRLTTSIRRVVRKKAAVDPLASLQIDGLSATPKEPSVELSLVWRDPQNPEEQGMFQGEYHWVQLICEGDAVVQVVAVRDKRYTSRYDSPKVPFNSALPATLTITDGDASDTFGVMSGVFQFEFGVFDFCLFLVIN